MKILFRIISILIIQAMLAGNFAWAGGFVSKEKNCCLSPALQIHSLENSKYFLAAGNIINLHDSLQADDKKSDFLPEWLNTEGLAQLKDLRIEKRVIPDNISFLRDRDVFDDIEFYITYKDENGFQKEVGFIRFWVYRDFKGARLFSDIQDNFNIQVVTFYPKLPHSKGAKENGEVLKAGLGISLLWLLLVHENNWQGKKGVLYNASKSSKIAFGKLNGKWPSIEEFIARPFLGGTVNIPPMRNIKFEVPLLNQQQKKKVKDFLENKIKFVDENSKKINVLEEKRTLVQDKKNDNLYEISIQEVSQERIGHTIEAFLQKEKRDLKVEWEFLRYLAYKNIFPGKLIQVKKEEEIIGLCAVTEINNDIAISAMEVSKDHRRVDIGIQMLLYIFDIFSEELSSSSKRLIEAPLGEGKKFVEGFIKKAGIRTVPEHFWRIVFLPEELRVIKEMDRKKQNKLRSIMQQKIQWNILKERRKKKENDKRINLNFRINKLRFAINKNKISEVKILLKELVPQLETLEKDSLAKKAIGRLLSRANNLLSSPKSKSDEENKKEKSRKKKSRKKKREYETSTYRWDDPEINMEIQDVRAKAISSHGNKNILDIIPESAKKTLMFSRRQILQQLLLINQAI